MTIPSICSRRVSGAPRRPRAGSRASWPRPCGCCGRRQAPLIVAGGGVLYSEADGGARAVREAHGDPGRGDPGGQGVAAARPPLQSRRDRRHRHGGGERACRRGRSWCWRSARGCRISPPDRGRCSKSATRGSSALNVQAFDAAKHRAQPLVADARVGLEALDAALLGDWRGASDVAATRDRRAKSAWRGGRARRPRRRTPSCRPTRR